jgi:hypothetical protein
MSPCIRAREEQDVCYRGRYQSACARGASSPFDLQEQGSKTACVKYDRKQGAGEISEIKDTCVAGSRSQVSSFKFRVGSFKFEGIEQ